MVFKTISYLLILIISLIKATEQTNVAVKYVHATNGTEIKEYGEFVEKFECAPFDPQMTEPINVRELDAKTLLELLAAYSKGNIAEMCSKKEENKSLKKRGVPVWLVVLIIMKK